MKMYKVDELNWLEANYLNYSPLSYQNNQNGIKPNPIAFEKKKEKKTGPARPKEFV